MKAPTIEDMEYSTITCKSKALKYIGKSIWYLCEFDIDKSGRGYYFPRFMVVNKVISGEFVDEINGAYVQYKKIVKLKVIE